MLEALPQLAAWCGTVSPTASGGIAISMLVAGAVASPSHCAPMCGGFVLGQVSDRMARLPASHLSQCHRLRAAGLTPYHLGRISTYTALGFAAGATGLALHSLGFGAGIFLLVGAALLVLQAAQRLRPAFRLPLTKSLRGYPLGLALGFLPCGILYAALAAAAATASPLTGALAMLSFGLGTVPALVVVGLFGAMGGHRFRRAMTTLAPGILLFNAGVLAVLGVRLLAG